MTKTLHTAFAALPLGAIQPAGWIRDQLQIQADGFTGHLDEHWPDVGPNNGWLGGTGESWERGPYYLDGLLPLAWLLDDEKLKAKASRWIEWTLNSQREDGMFGPNHITSVNKELNKKQDWWHLTIMLKVLTQYHEVSVDERVIPFLDKFFRHLQNELDNSPLEKWAEARGADLMLSVIWLYRRTGDAYLLELADKLADQTLDWSQVLGDFPFHRKFSQRMDHRTHVVNVAMGVRAPAIFYEVDGDETHRNNVERGIASLMTYHGQAHGMFSGDEWLSGTHPSQGVELCAVVEYMFSMEQLIRIFGDGKYGDILEKVAYNALPAPISKDWDSHQYDQQVNQVICNVATRTWSNGKFANTFGLATNFGCCISNMHQGWPKFVSHLWMASNDGGLVAAAYAPCQVRTTISGGHNVTVDVDTLYPFREQVRIKLGLGEVGAASGSAAGSTSAAFPLYLRVPGWCDQASLTINCETHPLSVEQGFARIERQWSNGDNIVLTFPMKVKTTGRSNYSVSVQRGPLVYALPIVESWVKTVHRERYCDWEIYPASPWKYGLLETELDAGRFEVVESDVPKQPFEAAHAPVRLRVKGQIIPTWGFEHNSADEPPLQPRLTPSQPIADLELVPYGSAKLRIGEFPVIVKPNRTVARRKYRG
jgi:DUF1680 family protein